jgi:4-hydroxymandelate oxidase
MGAMAMAGAAMPAAAAPYRAPTPPPVQVPRADLVNVLEYEAQARMVLGSRATPILGSDRSVTDRITLRPRMNIPTRDLDLTCTLFGDPHFTPIIVGPVSDQTRFHPGGEVAMARGASAAKAAMVISSNTSMPLATIAQAASTPLYVQVHGKGAGLKETLAAAPTARAVFVTVDGAHIDWPGIAAVVKATALPVVVKGITSPQDAKEAVARGAKGVVVSNWRSGATAAPGTLLLVAPAVQAVGDKVPVLVDGSFRRGTDIVKALAFGARGVLIGRPVMWGLAAYGADGVQGVVEMLQTELARYMCMCGRPSLAAVDDSLVRVHAAIPAEKHHG